MSRLNLSENLFLEKQELDRLVKFLSDDGYKKLFKSVINRFGITRNVGDAFQAVKKNDNEIVISSGLAVTPDIEFIALSEKQNISVTQSETRKWVVIKRSVTNSEDGVVSVDRSGNLTGVGTKFTEVLRGQPNFPVKVSFPNAKLNKSEYTVVQVNSDTKALLFGSMSDESGLRMDVTGTFTPGFIPSVQAKKIYEYDSCTFRAIESDQVPTIGNDEFFVCSMIFKDGIMYLSDERKRNMLNESYLTNDTEDGVSSVSSLSISTLKAVRLCSRLQVQNKGTSSLIELEFEHAYTVSKYDLVSNESGNILKITKGHCNFLTDWTAIPDNALSGFMLVNQQTGRRIEIVKNEGLKLYLSHVDFDVIKEDVELIIISPLQRADIMIKLDNEIVDVIDVPISVPRTRVQLCIQSPQNESRDRKYNIELLMRHYDLNKDSMANSEFIKLPVANFTNLNGEQEMLAMSSFVITKGQIDPEEAARNYS